MSSSSCQMATPFVGISCDPVTDLLQSGGFGNSYRGIDTTTNRPALIKERYRTTQGWQDITVGDLELMKQVSCVDKYRLQVYEFKITPDSVWLVTQYADKGNLEEYIKKHRPSIHKMLKIMECCVKAMQFFHCKTPPVIHGNLKPSNILFSSKGRKTDVKLSDFCPVTGVNTATLAVSSNEMFCAPEHFEHKPSTVQTDIFSLGLIFYTMVVFKGTDEHLTVFSDSSAQSGRLKVVGWDMYENSLKKQSIAPVARQQKLDTPAVRRVKDLINKMTDFDPRKRMSSTEVQKELKTIIEGGDDPVVKAIHGGPYTQGEAVHDGPHTQGKAVHDGPLTQGDSARSVQPQDDEGDQGYDENYSNDEIIRLDEIIVQSSANEEIVQSSVYAKETVTEDQSPTNDNSLRHGSEPQIHKESEAIEDEPEKKDDIVSQQIESGGQTLGPRSQELYPRIEKLEPMSQELEPMSQALEPMSQALEPMSQPLEPDTYLDKGSDMHSADPYLLRDVSDHGNGGTAISNAPKPHILIPQKKNHLQPKNVSDNASEVAQKNGYMTRSDLEGLIEVFNTSSHSSLTDASHGTKDSDLLQCLMTDPNELKASTQFTAGQRETGAPSTTNHTGPHRPGPATTGTVSQRPVPTEVLQRVLNLVQPTKEISHTVNSDGQSDHMSITSSSSYPRLPGVHTHSQPHNHSLLSNNLFSATNFTTESAVKWDTPAWKETYQIYCGDRVIIDDDEDRVACMQATYTLWKDDMKQFLGQQGVVRRVEGRFADVALSWGEVVCLACDTLRVLLPTDKHKRVPFLRFDVVEIKPYLTTEELRKIQSAGPGWNRNMTKCQGQLGVVLQILDKDVLVYFMDSHKWTFHKDSLDLVDTSLDEIGPGDKVFIISDEQDVQELQTDCGGWDPEMRICLGSEGNVCTVHEDIVTVKSHDRKWTLHRQCLRLLQHH